MRLFTALLIALTLPVYAEEITLASEPICPYICADKSSGQLRSPPGIVIEIARDALSLHGHTLKYQMRPLTRAIREVRAGHLDATLIWQENAPDFILPQEPVVRVDTCFFTRTDSDWHYRGIESLEKMRLGIILGDQPPLPEMDAYLRRHHDDGRIESAAGADATLLNIRKLLAGRIDLFFDEKLLAQYRISAEGHNDKIKLADCPTMGKEVYLAFSPDNLRSAVWAQQLSDGIRKLRASGRIKQIRAHYGVE